MNYKKVKINIYVEYIPKLDEWAVVRDNGYMCEDVSVPFSDRTAAVQYAKSYAEDRGYNYKEEC